jgi:uncharacterized MAPEG superfamily protein
MIGEGKISAGTLAMIKRWEGAHANSMENYTLLVAASLLACHAGVPTGTINGLMFSYTLARVCYAIAYIRIEKESYSKVRGLCWWWGMFSCLTLLRQAGKRL